MDSEKRRKNEKIIFFSLYIGIALISALYYLNDSALTGDWSIARTWITYPSCLVFISGVLCMLAIPVVRVFKQDCMKTENRLFKAAIVLLILGAIGYLLTHAFFGWS